MAHDFRSGFLRHINYNTLRPHTVARLTLTSGFRYVLDPSAAQFGREECLAPWDEYARRRIHHLDEVVDDTQGHANDLAEASSQGYGLAKKHVTEELVNVLRARKGGLRALLKLSGGRFEKAKTDLVNTMEESLVKLEKTSK